MLDIRFPEDLHKAILESDQEEDPFEESGQHDRRDDGDVDDVLNRPRCYDRGNAIVGISRLEHRRKQLFAEDGVPVAYIEDVEGEVQRLFA